MSPRQPIKLSYLDKSHMQYGGLLNKHICENQRTNGPVNAHLISWPSKAQNIQNLENIW